ncbi:MAG: hypothetical protein OHK0052_17870 [Anaerolineales bacterium]
MQGNRLMAWLAVLRRYWLLILVAVLGLGMMLFFGRRVLVRYFDLRGRGGFRPGEAAPPIEGWMTLPHVAKMYRVPPELLFEALKIPQAGNQRKSLDDLNREYAPDAPGKLIDDLRAFLQTLPVKPPRPHEIPVTGEP